MKINALLCVLISIVISIASPHDLSAQTTAFNYQGRLTDGGVAAAGTYSMKFSLFDAETGGTQVGTTLTNSSVAVANGIFAVTLDFGSSPFTGSARYLEVEVKKASDSGYTALSPRQQILSSPYSLKTLSASSADSLSAACVGCVSDSQIDSVSGSKVSGAVSNATSAASADTISATLPIEKGGTGSATKNFVDLSNNQTIAGNKEFTGTTKFSGNVEFAGKINTFRSISGYALPFIFPGPGYQFVGPTGTVTLNGNQTVAVSATASLGTTFGSGNIQGAVCYQNTAGGALYSLTNGTQIYSILRFQLNSLSLNATNTGLAAGDYRIGFCVYDLNYPLDFNDSVAGWVMVFQN